MFLTTALLTLSASTASAVNLWAIDYGGTVTTASLTQSNGSYSLKSVFTDQNCGDSPSWLTLGPDRQLFCLNEQLDGSNSSINSYTSNSDDSLKHVTSLETLTSAVHGAIFGNPSSSRGLVVAHYNSAAVSTWKISPDGGAFSALETLTFPQTGELPPHPHQAVVDPSGSYILVPDLGSDLVRIFSYDDDLKLTALDPIQTTPGYGPRHLAFWSPSSSPTAESPWYMFLVGELAGMVTSFNVTYPTYGGAPTFANISAVPPQADNPRNAPAEIQVDPQGKHLIVSNRDNAGWNNLVDSTGSSLSTFDLHADGILEKPTEVTSTDIGTGYPRHFSLNKDGSLVAVGLQYTNSVIILSRDVSTGVINPNTLATLKLSGQTTNVQWDD